MSGPDLFARPRGVRRGATLALVFAVVLATGAATGSLGRTDRDDAHDDEVRPVPAAQRVSEAAARAMIDGKSPTEAAEDAVSRSGDRWGAVYDAGEYEEFEQDLDGRYTGVGLWTVRGGDGGIVVDRVQRGGPADRAGIEAGDRLRTVDGRPVADRRVAEVVEMLRGERDGAGSTVELGLRRGARVWHETLHRADLRRETVAVERLPDGNVQIKVKAFTKGSGERVRRAVRQAPSGSGVLLDLRGNGGGLVDEAVDAASAFLDGGLVATYDVRGEQRALHASRGGDAARPVVALVDGGTMSAAELLTGALQDRGRAVVVGTRTFGKGSVQMPSKLPDGSVAELTVGHYSTPSGRNVDGRGLTPDLVAGDGAQERARTVLSGLGTPS
ncbi:putative CtpA-like serine protease [Streptomyces sp. YIM 130001]|uniref:S41 family peptidase n=1 Tax=Streptomyces sp. YIM 130001 TaxID=2259644 RepID=UPI000E65083C|nr:S41 family peptidase [Streptomyces sp. YIM 130001]RII19832.1 putative CtpA-like serine protease [Streptomyces sp. YIM 130001]